MNIPDKRYADLESIHDYWHREKGFTQCDASIMTVATILHYIANLQTNVAISQGVISKP